MFKILNKIPIESKSHKKILARISYQKHPWIIPVTWNPLYQLIYQLTEHLYVCLFIPIFLLFSFGLAINILFLLHSLILEEVAWISGPIRQKRLILRLSKRKVSSYFGHSILNREKFTHFNSKSFWTTKFRRRDFNSEQNHHYHFFVEWIVTSRWPYTWILPNLMVELWQTNNQEQPWVCHLNNK